MLFAATIIAAIVSVAHAADTTTATAPAATTVVTSTPAIAGVDFTPIAGKVYTSIPKKIQVKQLAHGFGGTPEGVCNGCESCGFWEGLLCNAGMGGGCYQACPAESGSVKAPVSAMTPVVAVRM